MEKHDFKKELKHLYATKPGVSAVVDVPAMNFLMIDGHGDPNSAPSFQANTEALYSLSYAIKFAAKEELQVDHTVPPLEGLWWSDDMEDFLNGRKYKWKWTLMIMQPEWITLDMVDRARETVRAKKAKKGEPVPPVDEVRFERFHEGLSVQVMYLGSYSEEADTINALHTFAEEKGYRLRGKHHELYIGDPRRTAPEKLKTVIRQPVE